MTESGQQTSRHAINPSGGVIAEVPSNIALVKYWGKRDPETQWPANDSLSMTLSTARTITEAELISGERDEVQRRGATGQALPATDKGLRHLAYLRRTLGFQSALRLTTENTFPSGCGIASSASGLGALTLAAVGAWTGASSLRELADQGYDAERLAALSRLGSGSACRSFFGGYVEWLAGETAASQGSRPFTPAASWPLVDLIVIVSAEAKTVSSSAGHATAWSSPLFAPRVAGIPGRMRRVKAALAAHDLAALGCEIEAEALDMHAVMLSATPSLNYLLDGSLRFLTWLRRMREESGLPAYFTIDAGPNLHVLCEPADAERVRRDIAAAFPQWPILTDRTGEGPILRRRSSP